MIIVQLKDADRTNDNLLPLPAYVREVSLRI
jgi:hypothetical protein